MHAHRDGHQATWAALHATKRRTFSVTQELTLIHRAARVSRLTGSPKGLQTTTGMSSNATVGMGLPW